jgi:hypothetical protein
MNAANLHPTGAKETSELRAAVGRDGYVVVPNVLSARDIGALRTTVSKFCSAGQGTYYENEAKANLNVFGFEPDEIGQLLGHTGIARVMKEIIGPDATFLRELAVGIGGSSGWHKDTHGLARSVRSEHQDYGVYKILIYPQDHIGLDEDDFALKVRKGSHWISDPKEGEIDTLFVRAGDIIIIDCRTSHRGRNSTMENASLLGRALYFPFNRAARGPTFEVRRKLSRIMGKQERQLVCLLYGKPNRFSEEYMRQGRALVKKKFPRLDVDQSLPPSWGRKLDAAGIRY